MKCAFVGISNWALDPAKMNRGIFVQRGTPNPNELTEIARLVSSCLYLFLALLSRIMLESGCMSFSGAILVCKVISP